MVSFYAIWGKYFGFPLCCTSAFVEHEKNSDIPYGQYVGKRKFYGTGFIPCMQCNEKTEKDLKIEIQKNRLCETAFPQEVSFEKSLIDIFQSENFSLFEKASFALQLFDEDWIQVVATLDSEHRALLRKICTQMDTIIQENLDFFKA